MTRRGSAVTRPRFHGARHQGPGQGPEAETCGGGGLGASEGGEDSNHGVLDRAVLRCAQGCSPSAPTPSCSISTAPAPRRRCAGVRARLRALVRAREPASGLVDEWGAVRFGSGRCIFFRRWLGGWARGRGRHPVLDAVTAAAQGRGRFSAKEGGQSVGRARWWKWV